MAPMPKQYGSPEASTATGSPRRARIAGMDWAMGLGQALSSPLGRSSARARCAFAADHQLGIGDEARAAGETLGPILADADDGEPSRLLTGGAHNATSA